MTVFSLPGPDKLQMMASSDNHQSFLLFYLTFFSRRTLFFWLQAHRTTTTVQLPQSLFKISQMSCIKGLDYAKTLITGFCGDNIMFFLIYYVYCEIRKWSLFLGFRSFPKSFYGGTAFLLRLIKSWNNKIWVQKFFAIKQFSSRA